MAEGFDFIQLGRPLIKDPAFVNNAMADRNYKNGCIHCNRCASLIEAPGGVYCPLNVEERHHDRRFRNIPGITGHHGTAKQIAYMVDDIDAAMKHWHENTA